ncbi:PWWP domain-containing DNA repair factor 3B-like isoform 1-T3 [Thomomys bottae]
MDSEDYVLCHWNGDLWPAKVLSRAGTQTNSDGAEELLLHVQILSVEETVQVRSTDVMPLTEAGIEAIASSAGLCLRANELPGDALCKDSGPPGQASAHTEALKVALEILSSRKLAGQGTPVEFPQSEPEGPRAQPGPGPCTDKKQQKRKESSESSLGKRACLPSKHADNDKESMAHTETASSDEMQAKVSNNSTVSAQIPTDDGAVKKECEENSGAATPESSNHLMFWNSPYAKDQFPGLFVRPVVVLNRLKDMRQKSQDSSAQIKVSEAHSVTTTQKGMEDSAKSALHAGLSREGTSSASPNTLPSDGLSTANQKRKRQEASFKTEAKKCRVPKTSNKTKNIVNKKEAERRKETRTKNVSPGRKAVHIEKEMLVWFKPKGYPFWPAVVKSVDQTTNTARVLLIEPNLRPEGSGIQVPLCNLKHMECRSKDKLVQRASQRYKLGMAWCLSLISHYEEEIVWKYFNGSFLDYFATSGRFPVRRAMENAELLVDFPVINYTDVGNSDGTTNPNVKTPICSTEGNPNLPECLNGESEMEEREQKEEEKKKKEGKGKNKKNLEREEENEQTEKDENVEEEEEKGEENQEMEGKLEQKQGEGKEKDEKRGKKNDKKKEKKLEEEIKVEKEEEKAEREGANKTEEGEEDRQEMEEKQEEEEEKELEEQEEENLEEENGEEEKEEELKVSIKEEMEENEEMDKNEEKEKDKKKEGKEWEEDTHVEGDEEKSEQRGENEEEEKVKEEKQDVEGDEEENEEEKEEAEEENKNEKGEKKELKEKENVEEEEMAEKEKQVVEEKQQHQEETNMEKIEKKDENDKEETLKMENGEVEKHEKEKMEKEEKEEK